MRYAAESLMTWIKDNDLLGILFGTESHPQLMKRSEKY